MTPAVEELFEKIYEYKYDLLYEMVFNSTLPLYASRRNPKAFGTMLRREIDSITKLFWDGEFEKRTPDGRYFMFDHFIKTLSKGWCHFQPSLFPPEFELYGDVCYQKKCGRSEPNALIYHIVCHRNSKMILGKPLEGKKSIVEELIDQFYDPEIRKKMLKSVQDFYKNLLKAITVYIQHHGGFVFVLDFDFLEEWPYDTVKDMEQFEASRSREEILIRATRPAIARDKNEPGLRVRKYPCRKKKRDKSDDDPSDVGQTIAARVTPEQVEELNNNTLPSGHLVNEEVHSPHDIPPLSRSVRQPLPPTRKCTEQQKSQSANEPPSTPRIQPGDKRRAHKPPPIVIPRPTAETTTTPVETPPPPTVTQLPRGVEPSKKEETRSPHDIRSLSCSEEMPMSTACQWPEQKKPQSMKASPTVMPSPCFMQQKHQPLQFSPVPSPCRIEQLPTSRILPEQKKLVQRLLSINSLPSIDKTITTPVMPPLTVMQLPSDREHPEKEAARSHQDIPELPYTGNQPPSTIRRSPVQQKPQSTMNSPTVMPTPIVMQQKHESQPLQVIPGPSPCRIESSPTSHIRPELKRKLTRPLPIIIPLSIVGTTPTVLTPPTVMHSPKKNETQLLQNTYRIFPTPTPFRRPEKQKQKCSWSLFKGNGLPRDPRLERKKEASKESLSPGCQNNQKRDVSRLGTLKEQEPQLGKENQAVVSAVTGRSNEVAARFEQVAGSAARGAARHVPGGEVWRESKEKHETSRHFAKQTQRSEEEAAVAEQEIKIVDETAEAVRGRADKGAAAQQEAEDVARRDEAHRRAEEADVEAIRRANEDAAAKNAAQDRILRAVIENYHKETTDAFLGLISGGLYDPPSFRGPAVSRELSESPRLCGEQGDQKNERSSMIVSPVFDHSPMSVTASPNSADEMVHAGSIPDGPSTSEDPRVPTMPAGIPSIAPFKIHNPRKVSTTRTPAAEMMNATPIPNEPSTSQDHRASTTSSGAMFVNNGGKRRTSSTTALPEVPIRRRRVIIDRHDRELDRNALGNKLLACMCRLPTGRGVRFWHTIDEKEIIGAELFKTYGTVKRELTKPELMILEELAEKRKSLTDQKIEKSLSDILRNRDGLMELEDINEFIRKQMEHIFSRRYGGYLIPDEKMQLVEDEMKELPGNQKFITRYERSEYLKWTECLGLDCRKARDLKDQVLIFAKKTAADLFRTYFRVLEAPDGSLKFYYDGTHDYPIRHSRKTHH